MTSFPEWLKTAWRRISLVVFALLVYFWAIKLTYCVHGYVTHGMTGLRNAIVHGAAFPEDPRQWGNARWGPIGLQYSAIALLTLLFGLTNQRALKRFWNAVWHHTPLKPDS